MKSAEQSRELRSPGGWGRGDSGTRTGGTVRDSGCVADHGPRASTARRGDLGAESPHLRRRLPTIPEPDP